MRALGIVLVLGGALVLSVDAVSSAVKRSSYQTAVAQILIGSKDSGESSARLSEFRKAVTVSSGEYQAEGIGLAAVGVVIGILGELLRQSGLRAARGVPQPDRRGPAE